MSEQVYRRLVNSMQQLGREMASTGGTLPDCGFIVSVRNGEIQVTPSPSEETAAAGEQEITPSRKLKKQK